MIADGQLFRTLSVIDGFTKQGLALETDTGFPGHRLLDGCVIILVVLAFVP